MSNLIRAQVWISGRVQSVGFRYWTANTADHLGGISGYVKNLSDGRVEAVLEGEEEVVERMLRELHQGPPLAIVREVQVERREASGEFKGFDLRY